MFMKSHISYEICPSVIDDQRERAFWEYFLKFSYSTADLYIVEAHKIMSEERMKDFQEVCRVRTLAFHNPLYRSIDNRRPNYLLSL